MVSIPKLLLRAELVIDFDATDFVEAGSYQQRLAEVLAGLRQQYPDARLSIRERRLKAEDAGVRAGDGVDGKAQGLSISPRARERSA